MKHKRFNEILPYTYFIKNIKTNKKYYGVRYGNIKLKLTPLDDFGKKYFTSSDYVDLNEKNIDEWEIKLHYTFDTINEAQEYEHKFLTKVYKKDDWLNKTNNRCVINDEGSRKKQIKSLKKLRKEKYWSNGLESHTKESKLKMSNSLKGKKSHRKNLTLEEEYGIEKAEKIRNKISKSKKGKETWNKGKEQSKEHKEKNPFIANNPSHNKEIREKMNNYNTIRYMIEINEEVYLVKSNKELQTFHRNIIKKKKKVGFNKWFSSPEKYNTVITKFKLVKIRG